MRHHRKSGFTLIELLIVVGIISILIVVLAIAVLPWIGKSDEKATRNLLQTLAPITSRKVTPTIAQFKKDAGQLSTRIAGDETMASSQMMLFYLAPGRSTWDGSALYKDRNYEPELQPENFAEFTQEENGRLPHVVDAWNNVVWYKFSTDLKVGLIYSAGVDGVPGNLDDLIYDPGDNKVKTREEMKQ